jgi:hypothetical protein
MASFQVVGRANMQRLDTEQLSLCELKKLHSIEVNTGDS